MPESSDELQIRIGVSVDGVDQATRKTDQAQTRVQTVQRQATTVDRNLGRFERRFHRVQHHMTRMIARQVIAGGLNEAFEELMPNTDHNAMGKLRQFGTTVAFQSLFMPNRYGPILGIVMAVIEGATELIKDAKEGLQKQIELREKLEDRLGDIARKLDLELEALHKDFDKGVQEFKDQYRRQLHFDGV